jgi:predicted MFS family arabinose efflux permease
MTAATAAKTTMTTAADSRMPLVIWAFAVCLFTFGCGEFVIPGLLLDISSDLSVPPGTAVPWIAASVAGAGAAVTLLAWILDLMAHAMPHAHD